MEGSDLKSRIEGISYEHVANESELFPGRKDSMNPKVVLWSAPDDDGRIASEVEMHELLYGLVRHLKPTIAIETGAHVGYATCAMGLALRDNQHGRLISCDTDPERVRKTIERCQGLPVEVRVASGAELPELPEADFVFIDSSFESRRIELTRLKVGAIAVVHDTECEAESEINSMRSIIRQFPQHVFVSTNRGFAIVRR